MPVRKVRGGYKCGSSGKTYKSKKRASSQCKAIYASKRRNRKKTYG